MNSKIGVKGFVTVPLEERFFQKVEKTESCWIWKGSNDGRGYGIIWVGGRVRKATQVSWELANKTKFPENKMACHSCDNPPCVNPNHIWPGTMSENILDARKKGRLKLPSELGFPNWNKDKKNCKRGHPFTIENTIILRNGRARSCRECNRTHQRNYLKRKAAADHGISND